MHKQKDFMIGIKRLFKELNSYYTLIVVAIILSIISSIAAIFTPNILSNLTDEISNGLVVNKENIELISNKITNNLVSLNINDYKNLSIEKQKEIFKDFKIDNVTITYEDQIKFLDIMNSDIDIYDKLDNLPNNIKEVIKPNMNIDRIKDITLILVIIYITSSVFNYIQSVCMTDVSNKFARDLRKRISNKINRLPLKYFDNNQVGDTLSRVTNDSDIISHNLHGSLNGLITSIILFIGTIIMMFYTNYILAITAICSSLIGFVFMVLILRNSQKYFEQKQRELGNLNGHIEEIYSGLNIVKVYNGVDDAVSKFNEYNKRVSIANRKSQFLSGLMMPIMGFIGNFGYVAVCIVGAIMAKNDLITFGVIVAFITYVRLFTSPLSQIAQATSGIQSASAASMRVFDILDQEEMTNQDNITKVLDKDKVKGKIEFNNVVFKYSTSKNNVINNFTAKVKPGEKIAIVGPTGAGKTTMVNLLMKFYEIESGSIKIDDVPISELSRENIHSLFTMVLQDTWLFEGTIKENIMYNRVDISEGKIVEVCKTIGLDHFIRTLENGYDSKISDSESVSSGQRQLLTIARGMIEDSPFLILDEATSNVDTRTEELVAQAMDKLMKGRTSFIIAHRLSTIKNADLILVMNEGNIVEQGTHKELMKKNGFYADLYNSQFKLNL